MEIGLVVRNMGEAARGSLIGAAARHAEGIGLDQVWVTDHIAIPPEESEGSGGRYLDPLACLAYLAACTTRIRLRVGVLVLPYRPALPVARWIASIQELSGGRLSFGAGVGWMRAEFKAVGVPFERRGRITGETLAFIRRCFEQDVMRANDQDFLFLPRPVRPPILVGGAAPHAFGRIVRHGDGWMPGRVEPEDLAPRVEALRNAMRAAGRDGPLVTVLTHLPIEDAGRARDRLSAYAEAGATGVAHFTRYDSLDGFQRAADVLASLR